MSLVRNKDDRRAYTWSKACHRSVDGAFTYADLASAAGMKQTLVSQMCRDWEDEGKLTRVPVKQSTKAYFRVPKALRGEIVRPAAEPKDTAQERIWRVMRKMSGAFDVGDVVMYANCPELEVTERDAQEYCGMLCRSGYLRVLRKAVPGKTRAVYRLIKDTGPRAPRERRIRVIWDDNLGEITHLPEGMSA